MTAEGSQRNGNGLRVFGRKHSQKGFLKLIQFREPQPLWCDSCRLLVMTPVDILIRAVR